MAKNLIRAFGRRSVVYLDLTDNSHPGDSDKIVSFHHRERRYHHATKPVILQIPLGSPGVDLPAHPPLV
jgi:hypothetical protein